jgi:Tfp pilus assembly protein PilW
MTGIRTRARRDDGLGLAELLVAMSLSVLLLVVIGGFFTAVIRSTAVSAVADTNARQASTAMATMVKYFHAATTNPVANQPSPAAAVVSAGATDVTFYAYVNMITTTAQPVMVRYYVDPTSHNLMEKLSAGVCDATTGYCTFPAVTTTITLGGPIASPTSSTNPPMTPPSSTRPLFTYLDAGGAPTTLLGSIDFVGINLELGSTKAGTAGDSHLSSTVGLLNLGQSGTSS